MEMSYSLSELSQVAGALLKAYGQKPIWAFQAPMGAGKTTLIAAICKEMGITDHVTSPTFAIMNQYDAGGKLVFHMDWYRIQDEKEALRTGIEAAFEEADICFIEWPENAKGLLPEDTQVFQIEILDPEHRRIFIPS
ncbi:MAG: tRNA ((37)-N6)-threonylcarbamoyltransferase complex ATPase subunit type 1 TsaE [Bacteroidota bacterium]|jgi:tRNA threonylcarbamoyladenosine biosynthesis protein TsaE